MKSGKRDSHLLILCDCLLPAIFECFRVQCPKAFNGTITINPVTRCKHKPSLWPVVSIHNKPYLSPDLLDSSPWDNLLHIESRPYTYILSVLLRYLLFIHRVLLYRMYNIKPQVNKSWQEFFNISAYMQPEMHTQTVSFIYQLLVIGFEKLIIYLAGENRAGLHTKIIADKYSVSTQFFPGPLHSNQIDIVFRAN